MTALPQLVGLAGWAGSGKDTAADALVAVGYQRRGFADALKELARRIGWDGHKDDTGRQLLQELGLGCRDIIGADVWVDALMHTIDGPTVISDVRFANELAAIADHAGVVVRVTRPGVRPARGHLSETALDDVMLPTIVNDADPAVLQSRLLDLLTLLPANPAAVHETLRTPAPGATTSNSI